MPPLKVPTIFSAVDKFSVPVNKMAKSADSSFARVQRRLDKFSSASFDFSKKTAIATTLAIAPMIALGNQAVQFEDELADVGKTTGLADEKLTQFGKTILDISKNTRTSVSDLTKITAIGGQLGVPKSQLEDFTRAADVFNVALGEDFGGVDEAVSQVGKIKAIFADTQNLDIAEVISRTGSAINTLGAVGSGTSQNITDFSLRIGALPAALKPTATQTLALGTALEEVGINSQIGASGLSKLLLTAGNDLQGFAKQMGTTTTQAQQLLANDPTQFVKQFAASFEGVGPDELAKKLKNLGLNSNEVIKVVGGLGSAISDIRIDEAGNEIDRFTQLQKISAKAFQDNISLTEEFNTKNNTAAGQMGQLKNQFQAVGIQLGQALLPVALQLADALVPMIDRFSKWIQANPKLVGQVAKLASVGVGLLGALSGISFVAGTLAKVMKLTRVAFVAYNVVLGINAALTKNSAALLGKSKVAMIAYNVAVKAATLVSRVFNAVLKNNPIGIVVTSALALAGAVKLVSSMMNRQTASQKLANDIMDKAIDSSVDQIANQELLFSTLKNTKAGTDEYKSALSQLDQQMPGIVNKYNLQKGAIEDLTAAQKELRNSLFQTAIAEAKIELGKEKIREAIKSTNRELSFQERAAITLQGISEKEFRQNQAANKLAQGRVLLESGQADQQQANQDRQNLSDQNKPLNPDAIKQSVTNESIQRQMQTLTVDFKNVPQGLETNLEGNGLISPSTINSN